MGFIFTVTTSFRGSDEIYFIGFEDGEMTHPSVLRSNVLVNTVVMWYSKSGYIDSVVVNWCFHAWGRYL